MATDCSGLAVPEVAMQIVAERHGAAIETAFACDILPESEKWLKSLGVGPTVLDMNMRVWNLQDGSFLTKDIDGNVMRFNKEYAIDL